MQRRLPVLTGTVGATMKTRGLCDYVANGNGIIDGAHLRHVETKGEKNQTQAAASYWVVTVRIPKDECDANWLADCRKSPVRITIAKAQGELKV